MVGVVLASRAYVVTEFTPYPDVCERNDGEWKHILYQQHGDTKEKSDVILEHRSGEIHKIYTQIQQCIYMCVCVHIQFISSLHNSMNNITLSSPK